MKRRSPESRVPVGSYCYGDRLRPGSRFATPDDAKDYIRTFTDPDSRERAWAEHLERFYCPYWREIGKGRCRCKLLGIRAVIWSAKQDKLAGRFYQKHPKAAVRDKGHLIGDHIKECDINPDDLP